MTRSILASAAFMAGLLSSSSALAAGWGTGVWNTMEWGEPVEFCGDNICSTSETAGSCAIDCFDSCDGVDNDNNGTIDDGNVCRCFTASFMGSDYAACTRPTGFDDAEAACDALGGYDLITMDDATEDLEVQTRLVNAWPNRVWWTSGNDIDSEGNFVWAGGMPFSYTNWYGQNQPDDFGGAQDCVGMWPGGFGWFDMNCDREMAFVCERETI
jgi:hypothetical protein